MLSPEHSAIVKTRVIVDLEQETRWDGCRELSVAELALPSLLRDLSATSVQQTTGSVVVSVQRDMC